MDVNKLIDEVFPIKIYENAYYPTSLSMSEKMYLGVFEKCQNIKKTDLIMLTQVSEVTLKRMKNKLQKAGLLKKVVFTPESAKQFVINHAHSGLKCEWCGKESYILHKHHFPIPRSKGGTNTVSICPNCHSTYHYIMEGVYAKS